MKARISSVVSCSSLIAAAALLAPGLTLAQPDRSWNFVVRLDGETIGTHRFDIKPAYGGEQVTSTANFQVNVLGLTVYRYRHESREQWRDGCLAAIDASTEDGGKRTEVRGRGTRESFVVDGSGAPLSGCLMSFAYWNADLPRQTQLLDPGTGRVVPVRIDRLAGARRWRITGLPDPIDIEWDDNRWVALDTVVSGRRLSYRLQ